MVQRQLRVILFVLGSVLFLGVPLYAQKEYNEKQLEVSLRTIGHQLLWSAGDSSSRVLPISKDKEHYKVQFESELAINPDSLIVIVNRVINEKQITGAYIIEVEKCKTNEVVYSYEVDSAIQLGTMPCRGRDLPKACYDILFTLKKKEVTYPMKHAAKSEPVLEETKGSNTIAYSLVLLLLLLPGALFFLRKKKKIEDPVDPNLLSIGLYQFNKKTYKLSLEGESVELSGKEADLLMLLHENINETLERDAILKKVWGDEGDYIGRTLDVFISKLRKKLEADSNIKIVNIRGVGYKLVVEEA